MTRIGQIFADFLFLYKILYHNICENLYKTKKTAKIRPIRVIRVSIYPTCSNRFF
jgi:hypothetical protein